MSPYALQFTKCCNVSYLTGNWSKMWAQELQQTNQGLTLRVLLVCLSCGEACLYLSVTSSKGGRIELPATNVPNWAEKQRVRENEASRQNDRNKRHVWYPGAAAAAAKSCQSCLTLCDPTNGRQPTRLLCPRDSPGKITGVGCHFLLQDKGRKGLKNRVLAMSLPQTALWLQVTCLLLSTCFLLCDMKVLNHKS